MVSSSKPKTKSSSSFDAFSKVDEIVAKPIVGSDGAASWQSFRNNSNNKNRHRISSAPKAPLKKVDRVTFSNWEEERDHEKMIRKDAGQATTGSGYVVFSTKNNEDDDKKKKERKRRQEIENRIRPEDKEYFIPSKTFEGWKFDYVFTTRNDVNNTGYYWDGMDSMKRENGEMIGKFETTINNNEKRKFEKSSDKKKKKKKKKNNGRTNNDNVPVILYNSNNPMEQIQAMLHRRNQQIAGLVADDDENLKVGWEAAKDPFSGNIYYFHRSTGDRTWEKPINNGDDIDDEDNGNKPLPQGWKSAVDTSSNKTYYHHVNGGVTWTRPK